MMKISGSIMDRLLNCPASKNVPDIKIQVGDDTPARLGSAVHEVASYMINQNCEVVPDLKIFMEKWGLDDEDDLRFLSWQAKKSFDSVKAYAKIVGSELPFELETTGFFTVSGTADLIGIEEPDTLIECDYKSGRVEKDATNQLKLYAHGHLETVPEFKKLNKVKLITFWLRSGEIEVAETTRDDLKKWFKESVKKITESDEYHAGEHCYYCPRNQNCPSMQMQVYNTVQSIEGVQNHEITDEMFVDLYPRVKMLQKVIDNFNDIFRARLHVSPLTDSDGTKYYLNEIKKDKLDIKKSFNIIKEFFIENNIPPSEIDKSLSISKTKLLKAVNDNSPKGLKGAQKELLMARLREEEGAVKETFEHRLTKTKGAKI
ncbi:MAG: hypothetical protein DRH26_01825 [Deltaproteobacteria bacterium]|nr:MAG: hypothetical protein DRH26_01825 [Deltaproteobacteria bacterium]